MVTKSKDHRRRRAELLGMPVGTAEKHLRKSIIHELAKQLGKTQCCRCGLEVEEPDDLAIVHVQDWEEEPDLFWALTNVAFSHASCEAARSGMRQREKKQMSKVEVRVEDLNGKSLIGTKHEGDLYVAGNKGARYNVRVRNRTNQSILVVLTVDGRNVITGKPGDHHDSGHVIGPRGTWVFKGWRTSDDEVAAFRFGSKKGSYSSQMGSAENVGVIGVAVFEEDAPDPVIKTVKETTYIPYPVPTPVVSPFTYPTGPVWTTQTIGTSSSGIAPMGSTMDSFSVDAADMQFSSGGSAGTFGSSGPAVRTTSSVSTSSTSSTKTKSSGRRGRGRGRGRQRRNKGEQQLGTEFGEALSSSVRKITFNRATEDPCEVHVIRYDSMRALEERGIMVRPSRRKKEPQPFPENDGYCQPPGGVRRERGKRRYR